MGVSVTRKTTPLWLNTDLDAYLRQQDDPGYTTNDAPNMRAAHGDARDDISQERRKSVRQVLSGFGVVHMVDTEGRTGRYRLAQLRDISTTGIGLRLNSAEPDNFGEGREFEILFQFSDHGKPLHMACTACRKALDEAGVVIGALFKNPLNSLAEVGCA